jgi:hypothetical protein
MKNKIKTIHQTIKNCQVGDMISDGVRTWKVSESKKDGHDCVVASPHNWDKKKMGSPFELWDDAVSRISVIPNLKVINFID